MGGGHKTVKYQFLDDGSPAPKPVAVEAPVSEADNDPETVEAEDLSELTVAELRVRADIAGVDVDGLLKAEIIDALEAENGSGDGLTFQSSVDDF